MSYPFNLTPEQQAELQARAQQYAAANTPAYKPTPAEALQRALEALDAEVDGIQGNTRPFGPDVAGLLRDAVRALAALTAPTQSAE